MLERWMLCFALPLSLVACGNVVEDQTSSSSGGSTMSGGSDSGSSGGNPACPTGEKRATLGDGSEGATNGIVSDADGVYWVKEDGTVWRAGPAGEAPEVLAKNLGTMIYTLAADKDALYVVDYATALYRVKKDTGEVTMLAQGGFVAVAVDEERVYLTQTDGVYSLDKQGGTPEMLAAVEGADSIAVDDSGIFLRSLGTVKDLTARVVRVEKTGGAPVDIAPQTPTKYHYFSQELALDATHVYWVHSSAGTISRAPKSGGAEEILAKDVADPISLTVDDAFVYFTVRGKDGGSLDERAVAKVPKAGGALAFVAQGSKVSAFGIAVDATNAYWTEHVTTGAVETACK